MYVIVRWHISHITYCYYCDDVLAALWLPHWNCFSESCTLRHVLFCDSGSPRVALVTSRREDPIQTVVHKSRLGHTPEYISDLLTPVAVIPARSALHASSCGNLVVPRTCRRIGDRAFSVAAPRAWNSLPTDLKLLRSIDSFRRN